MTQRIAFQSKNGQTEHGEIALPTLDVKAPALVVVQEYWGVNDHIRSLVDRFAAEGFLSFAPDLFHGRVTRDPKEAAALLQALDWPRALADIGGAVAMLAAHPRSNGKVGVIGFCMGGGLTLAAAARVDGISAAAPFYGLPDPSTDYARVMCPVQGHYAKKDSYYPPEVVEGVKTKLEHAGKKAEFFLYDAGHAFVNDARPEAYDEASAKLAWGRAVEFLKAHLVAVAPNRTANV